MKPKSDEVKYWCWPEVDQSTYAKSLSNMKYFPDPLENIIGFVCSDKRRSPNPSPTKFINTTTSYLSDVSNLDVSGEEVKEPKSERSNLYPDSNYGL